MALTLNVRNAAAIGLDEYVRHVESYVDVDDPDSLAASAHQLKALANNRMLIGAFVDRELRNWRDFQSGNAYIGRTLMLARRERFFVRANMWVPPTRRIGSTSRYNNASEYQIAHDHNFSFLTAGYMGAGYQTEIYEIEPKAIVGVEGERVELRFLERTRLPEGKIMMYRAAEDVHCQHFPEEFSISLNLMVPTQSKKRPQYFFDLERGTITGRVYTEQGRGLAICELAKHVGSSTTTTLLGDIALTNHSAYLRSAAFEALNARSPNAANAIRTTVLKDDDKMVRHVAERAPAVQGTIDPSGYCTEKLSSGPS